MQTLQVGSTMFQVKISPKLNFYSDINILTDHQDSAGKALVENKISFAHLPEKLKKRVEAFTEPWEAERDALKEVEVVGWQEKGQEIPSRTELQERWQEVRREGSDLDLEEALDLDVDELPGPVSWPRSRVKVRSQIALYNVHVHGLYLLLTI